MNSKSKNLFLKPAVIASIILAGGLTLTGCTTSAGTAPTTDGKTYGVFKDFTEDKKVTDEFGEYTVTKLNPSSTATVYDITRTQPDLYRYGFTDTDAKEAQQVVANFVASEGVDSIMLDNTNNNQKWLDANFDKWLGGPFSSALKEDILNANSEYSFVVKGLPLTVRDGKPRILSNSIHINNITASKDNSGKYIEIYGNATTQYRASEKNIMEYAIKANAEQKLDAGTISAVYPKLKDGKEEVIDSSFNFRYFLQKIDGKWKIVNYNNYSTWQIESMRADNSSANSSNPTPAPTATATK